jgi:hypothetical protein
MVHRIDIGRQAVPSIEFQGVLDGAALFEIRRHVRGLAATGARVRLVLKTGTEVEPSCVDALKTLGPVDLVAESGFLARWLGAATPSSEKAP